MWQKAARNTILQVLLSLTNMAGVAEPARCKGEG